MTKNSNNLPELVHEATKQMCEVVPSMKDTQIFTKELVDFLFPIRRDRTISLHATAAKWEDIQKMLIKLLIPFENIMHKNANDVCQQFCQAVPDLYAQMLNNADAYCKFDPAAMCGEEVILCYPGFYAVCVYRLAHVLHLIGVPTIPRLMTEYAHTKTGIDIHPGASIDDHFFIDHGTGIVIGETTIIGRNVKVYQGVTLGSAYVDESLRQTKRHPTIEDNVILYAGCTILGGNTVIGHDTIIGGNVWLTESVPPYSMVYNKHDTVVRPQSQENKKKEELQYIYYI